MAADDSLGEWPIVGGNETGLPCIAAFDFDGTLTYGDSLLPFLRFVVGRRRFWSMSLALLAGWLRYRTGRTDRSKAKEHLLRRYLGGWSVTALQAAGQRFSSEALPRLVAPAAMDRLRAHERAGHKVVIISASLELYLKPWAEAHTRDGAVLGTRLREDEGLVTGEMDGPNCVGPEKVQRLMEWAGDLDACYLFAYGDSRGDLELLSCAREPAYRSFLRPKDRLRGYLRLLRAIV